MANKRVENPKRIKKPEAYEYEQEYLRKNIKHISVPFNVGRNPTERELYEWLSEKKKEVRIGGLIKQFLMQEMEKDKNS